MLGWATVRDAEPIIRTDYEEFHRPENEALHHITRGSAYDMKPGETKYGYYMDSPRREAPYTVTERGNVSRDVYKPIQKGQTVIPPASETRESKADHRMRMPGKYANRFDHIDEFTKADHAWARRVMEREAQLSDKWIDENTKWFYSATRSGSIYGEYSIDADGEVTLLTGRKNVPPDYYKTREWYKNGTTNTRIDRAGVWDNMADTASEWNPRNAGRDALSGVSLRGGADELPTSIEGLAGVSNGTRGQDSRQRVHRPVNGTDAEVPEDTRKSKVDEEYLELAKDPAANRGRLQEMVAEAAAKAGYTIEAYHGTGAEFTAFDSDKVGANYNNWLEFGAGFYFTPNYDGAKRWAQNGGRIAGDRVISAYLNADRMLNADDPVTDERAVAMLQNLGYSGFDLSMATRHGYRFINALLEHGYTNTDVQDALKEMGYDGVDATLDGRSGKTGQYVVFDPSQIKSADPVTYDADGNVIPLSERFKTDRTGEDAWKNSDIRYAKVDEEGRIENPYAKGTLEYELLNRVTGSTPEDVELWLQSLLDKANGITREDITGMSAASEPLSTRKGFAIPPRYTQADRDAMTRLPEELRGNYGALKEGENAAWEANFPQRVNDETYVRRFRRTATEAKVTPA